MAGFLYFVPGWDKTTPDLASLPAATGLAAVLSDVQAFEGRQSAGPEGFGCLFCAQPAHEEAKAPACIYEPGKQRWLAVLGADGKATHWIGAEKANQPRPEDLLRATIYNSRPVWFHNGLSFFVPECHPNKSALEQRYVLGPGGVGKFAPLEKHAAANAVAERFFSEFHQLMEDGKKVALTKQEYVEAIPVLLTLNYRVGPWECSALDLLVDHPMTMAQLVISCTGWKALSDEIEAREKKDIPSDGSSGT